MSDTKKNKQIVINMLASLLSCLVSMGVSFILAPKLINSLGIEANGFLTMANDFVNFASVAAMALNSMAGRFITVKIHQKDMEGANQYFNSVMYANLAIAGFLFVPLTIIVLYLDKLINISPELVSDVKLLFAAIFLNFMVTIISTTFSTATFATNRLDLTAMRTIESQILKGGLLILVFYFLPIKVSYMGIATLASTAYLLVAYIYYTKKLLPDIKISRKHFRIKKVLEILSAGIWNTIMRTGQLLTNSLDTVIANLAIGATEMGYVGTSKSMVSAINMLYETISAVFTPSLTISFAKNDRKELLNDLTSAMCMTGFFANIPLAFVAAFGIPFYTLWLNKTQSLYDPTIIYALTLFTMFGTIVGGAISPLFNVYTVVNKLKWNSIVTLIMGILSTGIVLLLIETTDTASSLGMYYIVGTSTILGIIKNMTFTPMYAAHCLGLKKTIFYPTIFRYIAVSLGMIAVFMGFNHVISTTNWLILILDVFLCGITGAVINFIFLFGKRERDMLLDTVFRFVKRG
ncbi:MAG: oligosaccharide flippase family protein [Roseburia sp.]|nr:oligosaccharide flippase family protein [Roseburia sp.]MCM1278097.1 oligosaccharide flippase family protein [Robinsoniella sp.]